MELEVWLFLGSIIAAYVVLSRAIRTVETNVDEPAVQTSRRSNQRTARHRSRSPSGTSTRSSSTRTTRQARTVNDADPKDTADYLASRGWLRLERDDGKTAELYDGWYRANGVKMQGVVEKTASGRGKFYVVDPPKGFIEAADDGDCLIQDGGLGPLAAEVHFAQKPDTLGDGIETIEDLLADAHE